MALPKIQINLGQGRLNRTQTITEQVALVNTATAVASTFSLSKAYTVRSIRDATALGITSTNNPSLLSQIEDFYQIAGTGAALILLGISRTTTYASLTQEGGAIDQLLKDNPIISLVAINHLEHTSNRPSTVSNGLPGRVHAAVPLLQQVAARYRSLSQPIHIVLAANQISDLNALENYAQGTYNHVSLLVSSIRNSNEASVGFTIGYLSTLPVQRKLSRVYNGALPIQTGYFTSQQSATEQQAHYETLHQKRYLFIRTYTGRTGYYFADDLALASQSSDYSTIANNRVINQLIRISQAVFINEIGNEVTIAEDGSLAPEAARYYESLIENAVNLQMVSQGALSNIAALVDTQQKVLQTDELRIELEAQPVGYTNTLRIDIGFALALNTA